MTIASNSTRPWQSFIVRAMNSPTYDWTRQPQVRRRLVVASGAVSVALVGALASAGVLTISHQRGAAIVAFVTAVLLIVPFWYVTGCLNASVRGAADPLVATLPGGHDEWQRRVHAETYRRCYLPALGVFSAAFLVTIVARLTIIPALSVFLIAYLIGLMAPLWTMAWTLPQDPNEV